MSELECPDCEQAVPHDEWIFHGVRGPHGKLVECPNCEHLHYLNNLEDTNKQLDTDT